MLSRCFEECRKCLNGNESVGVSRGNMGTRLCPNRPELTDAGFWWVWADRAPQQLSHILYVDKARAR